MTSGEAPNPGIFSEWAKKKERQIKRKKKNEQDREVKQTEGWSGRGSMNEEDTMKLGH